MFRILYSVTKRADCYDCSSKSESKRNDSGFEEREIDLLVEFNHRAGASSGCEMAAGP
jgi:hypothetical protein